VRDALRSGPVDLFLSYFYNAHFDPAGFEALRDLGIPSINFFCNSMYQFAPFSKGAIPFQNIAEVFARHEICLNFSSVRVGGRPGSALIPHVRLRDFEAPMCRTCYLTGFSDEIAEFYEQGKEIDTYRTPEELVDKIRFYLGHAAAAEKMRSAAYERAVHHHTWTKRFEQLFREAELDR
jgi:hypothetical protein